MDEPISDSPLFTLSSVLVEFLKVVDLETASPSAQGKGSEKKIPSIDLVTPSR